MNISINCHIHNELLNIRAEVIRNSSECPDYAVLAIEDVILFFHYPEALETVLRQALDKLEAAKGAVTE